MPTTSETKSKAKSAPKRKAAAKNAPADQGLSDLLQSEVDALGADLLSGQNADGSSSLFDEDEATVENTAAVEDTQDDSGDEQDDSGDEQDDSGDEQDDAADEQSDAAKRVADALRAVEPNFKAHQEAEMEDDKAISADRLAPISRPGGQTYVPRPVTKSMTDIELLRRARENSICALLEGYPGTGKTAVLEAAFDGEVLTVNGNADMTGADFKGSYVAQPDGEGEGLGVIWQDGPLVQAMKEGKVLFVDDLTLIPANVISLLYPLMDGRDRFLLTDHASEEIIAQPGFYICGAHNPGAYGAVLAEALSSRFGIQLTVNSDLAMAQDHFGVDERIVQAATQLQAQRSEDLVAWAPEMRELLAFQRNVDVFGYRVAVNNLISVAPHEDRDKIAEVLVKWFDYAEPLSHQRSS